MIKFPYSLDNKRYHTLHYHNMTVYGKKAFKAVIDAGFTCPNIDGSKGTGGCIFCRDGSGYFTATPHGDIESTVTSQLAAEKERIHRKYPNSAVIAYFQANTNTYAPTETLRRAYYAALLFGVDGIAIGTRADCLGDDVMDLLNEINGKTRLTVELGLQSVHDRTIKIINRGYTHAEFLSGYEKLKSAGIRTVLHIINGLPRESYSDMLDTARQVGQLSPAGVKIHLLHVNADTELFNMYAKGEYTALTKSEYIDTVVHQLEYLPKETVIERITGDGDKRYLIAPKWSMDKISVLGGIDLLQKNLDSYQGKALD